MEKIIGLIAGKSGDSLTDELHEKGYKVALICGKRGEPGSDKADFVGFIDIKDSDGIISFFNKYGVTKVIVGTGHRLAFKLTKLLQKSDIVTNIDIEKSELAKNKWMFKEAISAYGIRTPKAIVLKSGKLSEKEADIIDFPCVAKSTNDAFQPEKIHNRAELFELMEREKNAFVNSDLMLEQFIDGYDCTVAVANDGISIQDFGVLYYSKAKEYRLKGFDAPATKKFSEEKEREVCEIARKIVRELNFPGLVRVDFIVADEDIFVLELNSVIVTGYHGSAYPFFKERNINIARESIGVALKLLGEEL